MLNLKRGGLALAFAVILGGATAVSAQPLDGGPDLSAISGDSFYWNDTGGTGGIAILVSIPQQRIFVYRDGVVIGIANVSTGRPGHETPTGDFSILEKQVDHHSNLYDDAAMPYMERLTWDGVALHAGKVVDHPASHGCVRLPLAFAKLLYRVTSVGAQVTITDEDDDAQPRDTRTDIAAER